MNGREKAELALCLATLILAVYLIKAQGDETAEQIARLENMILDLRNVVQPNKERQES